MEQKLTIKISQRINAIMNVLDKALKDKHGSDKEFCGLLIAPRDNIWMCEDMVIPKQKVTGTSVKLPKDGKYSPYQRFFEEYCINNDTHVIIGTIHSHNNMSSFFSGGDDEDLLNNAFLNLGEDLPFIDIVWSKKDNEYKGRVRLKIGKGNAKQIFTHDDCDVKIEVDVTTISLLEKIKSMVTGKYAIHEENLKKSILPVIDVEEMMKNIEVEQYSNTSYRSDYGGYGRNTSFNSDVNGGNVKIDISDFDENKKILELSCEGKERDISAFLTIIEEEIRRTFPMYEVKSTSFFTDKTTLEISCESKKRYKKLKSKIERFHQRFTARGKLLENKVNNTPIRTLSDYDDEDDYLYGLYGGNKEMYPSYVG